MRHPLRSRRKARARVEFPAARVSSLTFGGPDLDEIYVTTAALNNCLMLAPEGYDPAQVFVGGPLYRARLGIKEKLKFHTRVRIFTPARNT
jgi:sugar lactone lactonase YvrE